MLFNSFLKINRLLRIIFIFLALKVTDINSQIISFPEAEGWGKYSIGGRGGRIIEVTTLADSGLGSLRSAIEQSGARIIIFKVSGNISLSTNLTITNDSITIAGQTAPGGGVCIKNFPLEIRATEVIIRYLRFRQGDETRNQNDALNILYSKNVIIDHCSVSWGIDENLSCWGNENVTVQWCLISESLNNSFHEKGPHGYGGIWGGKNSTFHHNLFAHNSSRNPRFSGGSTGESINVDFRNNVIYNWGFNSSYGGEKGKINIVKNYYKPGPGTLKKVRERIVEPWDSTSKYYISGNQFAKFSKVNEDNWNGGVQSNEIDLKKIKVDQPFYYVPIVEDQPEIAFNKILRHCGASIPNRDLVDERIIKEVSEGNASFGSKLYNDEHNLQAEIVNGMIDSQEEVGGWPELKSAISPEDSDHDGIPNEWEKKNGIDPDNYEDRNQIAESGYTMIEEYLNELGSFYHLNY